MDLRDNPRRRREHPDMEMTPLIDVVFLLLIFFVVTTSFSQMKGQARAEEEQIPVDLPEATTGQSGQQGDRVTLYVRPDGSVELRGEVELVGETFEEKLADLQEKKPDVRIDLKGDAEASHGRIIELFDAIRRAGFKSVNLMTEKPDSR